MGDRATVDTHFGGAETSLAGIKGDSFQTEWLNKQRGAVCAFRLPLLQRSSTPSSPLSPAPAQLGQTPWHVLGGALCVPRMSGVPCTPRLRALPPLSAWGE